MTIYWTALKTGLQCYLMPHDFPGHKWQFPVVRWMWFLIMFQLLFQCLYFHLFKKCALTCLNCHMRYFNLYMCSVPMLKAKHMKSFDPSVISLIGCIVKKYSKFLFFSDLLIIVERFYRSCSDSNLGLDIRCVQQSLSLKIALFFPFLVPLIPIVFTLYVPG